MPQAVSRKQYRMMMAIIHGKHVDQGSRGRPPKSIAEKYTAPEKGAPESKGNNRGGSWTDKHHDKHSKKHKEKVKKSFDEFYKGSSAATIVFNDDGDILMGKQKTVSGHFLVVM